MKRLWRFPGCAVANKITRLSIVAMMLSLQGCATAFAIADVAGATVIYAGKTVVNTIDAVTPDIVNKKK
jgi:hypothetical protein